MAEAAERLTVRLVEAADSSEEAASAMDKLGAASSSVIVRVAVASVILAFVGLEIVTVIVSLFSSVESEAMGTVNVPLELPAVMESVPEVDV